MRGRIWYTVLEMDETSGKVDAQERDDQSFRSRVTVAMYGMFFGKSRDQLEIQMQIPIQKMLWERDG